MIKKIYYTSTLIFLLCFGIFVFSLFRHFDPDLWGHLRFGKYILENGIPYTDMFSFQITKPIWVNHEWLSEVIMYFLYSLDSNGFYLLLFKALLCTAIFLLAFYKALITSKPSLKLLIPILIASMLVFTYGSAIRPQLFSYILFAVLLFILDKYKLQNTISYIVIPILFVIWVNMHGGFVAGLIIVILYSLYQVLFINKQSFKTVSRYKPLIIPIILLFIPFITPYGLNYYPYIIDAISMKRPYIEEWQPLFASNTNNLYTHILIIVSVLIIFTGLKNINKSNIINMIILSSIFIVSVFHVRHIPFFAIACSFYLADLLPKSSRLSKSNGNINARNIVYPMLILFLSLALVFNTFFKDNTVNYSLKIDQITSNQITGFPVNAVIFINNNKIHGRMLTNFNWGEFIIFFLYPQVKVSIDGRYETVYFNSTVKENFAIVNAEKGWLKYLYKMNPDIILISKFDPLAKELPKVKEFQLIFKDYEGLLYINKAILSR